MSSIPYDETRQADIISLRTSGVNEPSYRAAPAEDNVRQYLGEMGAYSLLSRDEEVALARRVIRGHQRMRCGLSRSPWMWRRTTVLLDQIRSGEQGIRDLLDAPSGVRSSSRSQRVQAALRTLQPFRAAHDDFLSTCRAPAPTAQRLRAVVRLSRVIRALPLRVEAWRRFADEFSEQAGRPDVGLAGPLDLGPRLTQSSHEKVLAGRRQADIAKARLVESNLRLVVSVAKRYVNRGLPILDLIQEGNIGLMHAVDKFDVSRGFKFSTYAHWWIKQSMHRALTDKARTVRIPVHASEQLRKIKRAYSEIESSLERPPTDEELAEAVDLELDDVRMLRSLMREPVSLDMSVGCDSESTLGGVLADETLISPTDAMLDEEFRGAAIKALSALTPAEQRILRMRYGIGYPREHTLQEIGREFRLTRERIRQIESKALAELRSGFGVGDLRRLWESCA